MALFDECMQKCAQKVVDWADIPRPLGTIGRLCGPSPTMSFSVASYFTCSPSASSASITSASLPMLARYSLATVLRCPPCSSTASPIGTLDRTNHPALMALSQVRWTDGRRRTTHRGATPTPFSTTPGHSCMNSFAHTPHSLRFRAFRRSASPLRSNILFLRPPNLASAIDSSAHSCARFSSTGVGAPANSYTLARCIQFA